MGDDCTSKPKTVLTAFQVPSDLSSETAHWTKKKQPLNIGGLLTQSNYSANCLLGSERMVF